MKRRTVLNGKKMWRDENAFGGDWAMFFFMIAMFAATVVIVAALMGTIQGISVDLLNGNMDEKVINTPVVQQTYKWTSGIIMASLSLAIVFVGAGYMSGAFSPEAAAKSKGVGTKLILAICIAPVIYIPLNMIIQLNLVITRSFLSMSISAMGAKSLADLWSLYFGVSVFSAYNIVPMFGLVILGLAMTLFGILIFRLIFLTISYALSPMSIVLCVFPQTEETGRKLIKIFFEATFGLLFLDIGLMFTFSCFSVLIGAYGSLNPAIWFLLATAGLSFPVVFYKIMFNPIGNAVGRGLSAGMGAISGSISSMPRAIPAGGTGGKGGGGGGGLAFGAKAGGGRADKMMSTGKDLMKSSGTGVGAAAGAALIGGALAFKAGQKGKEIAEAKMADRKDYMGQMKERAATKGFAAQPAAGIRGKMEEKGITTPKAVKDYKRGAPGLFAKDQAEVKSSIVRKRAEDAKDNLWGKASSTDVKGVSSATSKEGREKLKTLHEKIDNGGITKEDNAFLASCKSDERKYEMDPTGREKDRQLVKDKEAAISKFEKFKAGEGIAVYAASDAGRKEFAEAKERERTGGIGEKKQGEVLASRAFLANQESRRKGLSNDDYSKLIDSEKRLSEDPNDKEARDTRTMLTNKQNAWDKEHNEPHRQGIAEAERDAAKYRADPNGKEKDRQKIKEMEEGQKRFDDILPEYTKLEHEAGPEGQKEMDDAKERLRTKGLGSETAKKKGELGAQKETFRSSGEERDVRMKATEIEKLQRLAESKPELKREAEGIIREGEKIDKKTGKKIKKIHEHGEKTSLRYGDTDDQDVTWIHTHPEAATAPSDVQTPSGEHEIEWGEGETEQYDPNKFTEWGTGTPAESQTTDSDKDVEWG